MKSPIDRPMYAALMLICITAPLRAQIVNDGATNTLSNVTNSFTGDVTVGTNGSFTLLVVSSNALVTNSANGNVGLNSTAKSNEVRLVSPTARWFMGNNLFVGNNGSFSRLVVSNGAQVRNNTGFVGPNVPSSNNVAVVTGPGSVWSNANVFYLGFSGAGNRLVVSNGGVLRNNPSTIGVNGGSSNNVALVTGSGSLWSNASTLQLGFSGAGNQLVVSNGGFVRSSVGAMGSQPSGSNTVAVVTGSGSTWSNAAELYVGNSSASNLLLVSAGGTVRTGHGYVGANFTASNNLALVTDPGSTWSNALDLNIGAFSANNRMIVSNGATVFAAGNGLIGPTANGNGNSVTVTDPGSQWLVAGNIRVGFPASFCQMLVNDGARVENTSGFVGSGDFASNNLAVVKGAGTVWSNALSLFVGNASTGNQLVVSNSAAVFGYEGVIGYGSNGSNNLATVTGAGSVWSNAVDLFVGNDGGNNQLVVSDGGMVRGLYGTVGLNVSSSNNVAVVTGSGSLWSNAVGLFVGNDGRNNQLIVTSSGSVRGQVGTVGLNASSSNNVALVTGAGSLWTNDQALYVGNFGGGNSLVVSNGGSVFSATKGFIGFNSTAISNNAIVTDPGSRWMGGLQSDYYVGSNSPFNRLIITNGGLVADNVGYLGHQTSGRSNLVLVTGAGSTWSNRLVIEMGERGSGNRMVISNGGLVHSLGFVRIGRIAGTNNQVIVTGVGSLLRMPGGNLRVGESAGGNRVEINNGGTVLSQSGEIGADSGSSNEALVTGPGSLWANAGSVIVGRYGNRGRLIVSNAATFLSGAGVVIGEQTIATNNRVVVDGGALFVTNAPSSAVLEVRRGTNLFNAGLMVVDQLRLTNTLGKFEFNGGTLVTRGAAISNNSPFTIGNAGSVPAVWDVRTGASNHFVGGEVWVGGVASFAQLILTNGALLTNDGFVLVGAQATSHSNTVTLAGSGSQWSSGGGMIVGSGGIGNRLVVRDGASLVTASISYFGDTTTSSNNEAVVTGPGSSWFTANHGLRVGDQGRDNRLRVSDGGVVTSFDDWIGVNTSSSNNQVLVTGLGSLWNNTRELTVGLNSSGNQLVVSNGGTVFTVANKYVGQNDGARSNTVIVTDAGSAWLGDDSLYVGSDGSLNRLFVRNGGRVTSGIATLGASLGADGNLALIADASSVLSNRFDLNVGDGGSANQLVLSNSGAIISASHGFIGRNNGASSNTVVLTDLGTRWLLSSNLYVGSNGTFSRLTITNGAHLENTFAAIGVGISSSNNEVVITGAGSIWTNRSLFHLGESGRGNRLVVTHGGRVDSENVEVGLHASSSNNEVIITGPGTFCRVQDSFTLGSVGSGNRLVVSNGAWLHDDNGEIGSFGTANEAVVTGPGTTWTNRSGLIVGGSRGNNRLVITNGAFVFSRDVYVSFDALSTNNRVVVDGGTLLVTNSTGVGALDVRRGTNVFNAGLIEVARLLVTNALGQFEFNGGTLVSSGTAIGNGRGFTVGNGTSAATFSLRNGTHSFASNLVVASNASVIGNGTITGILTVQAGGKLSPGTSIGDLILSNSPVLQGATIMEISKSGATPTHDHLQVIGPLTYGGSLIVSNLGPTALALGDRFQLFSAASYGGAFSSVTLPPLPSGLIWTNKLAVDGSLEVAAFVPPSVTLAIQRSNNFVILSWPTNAADYCLETSADLTPPVYWQPITGGLATNDTSFVLSLPNNATVAKQFFRLAFPCNTASVTLAVERSNNLLTLVWPSHAFRLETTFNLAPPVKWQTVTNGITSTGAGRTFTFTNSPAVMNQFFRLAFP